MESFYLGTLTNSRPPWPAIPPRSGQIPRFFPGFRQITQTHAMRNQKTTRCQQVENSQVRHTRTTPNLSPVPQIGRQIPVALDVGLIKIVGTRRGQLDQKLLEG